MMLINNDKIYNHLNRNTFRILDSFSILEDTDLYYSNPNSIPIYETAYGNLLDIDDVKNFAENNSIYDLGYAIHIICESSNADPNSIVYIISETSAIEEEFNNSGLLEDIRLNNIPLYIIPISENSPTNIFGNFCLDYLLETGDSTWFDTFILYESNNGMMTVKELYDNLKAINLNPDGTKKMSNTELKKKIRGYLKASGYADYEDPDIFTRDDYSSTISDNDQTGVENLYNYIKNGSVSGIDITSNKKGYKRDSYANVQASIHQYLAQELAASGVKANLNYDSVQIHNITKKMIDDAAKQGVDPVTYVHSNFRSIVKGIEPSANIYLKNDKEKIKYYLSRLSERIVKDQDSTNYIRKMDDKFSQRNSAEFTEPNPPKKNKKLNDTTTDTTTTDTTTTDTTTQSINQIEQKAKSAPRKWLIEKLAWLRNKAREYTEKVKSAGPKANIFQKVLSYITRAIAYISDKLHNLVN